jgi:ABC-type dipeptide/oligopeptide/nickel transport system permease component
VQYLYYVRDTARLDLGPSLVQRNQDVNDVIKEHFPTSIKLGLMAMIFAIVVGIPLGVFAALKHNSVLDYTAMGIANLGFALPSFLVATLLIYFFALRLKDYTGLPTNGWEGPSSWVLPTIALGIYPMTYFARLVRGTVLETLQQDYIRTAKAKGLRWRFVVGKHVLRNSLIPAVTAAGPVLGGLITGSFIVETIFGIPGIGRYYVTAVTGRDYSVVMGITVLLSVIIIVANLVVDILYGYLDPRIRDERT